ncbi:hypothetical protein FOA43_001470 [Brettanomyces nanus]|uniref:Serine/threonine-protein phosphatase 2A activator n=1 Tax=Eeniella nana TaxID=13502 RepID=A0A875RYC6_EENNA|nr:uncharacterized protein FOA43_001470 [Brettanomyces nanus]QPG74146.1 hypothetical protein FOA43_001470 [Brettanomyces nanus]
MHSNLPHINPKDPHLDWIPPCKRIYGPKEVVSFQKSVAIERIQSTLFLICSKISLTDVPHGVLDDQLVAFENARHPGVAMSGESRARERQMKASINSFDLPPPVSDKFSIDKMSKPVLSVLRLLDELKTLMDETPPFPGPRRYGNMACRDWHDKLSSRIDHWLDKYMGQYYQVPQSEHRSYTFFTELRYYFLGSFGSRERLDFGTGHELSFLAFLSCLIMTDIFPRDEITGQDYLVIFSKYYDFVRTLILTYTLEPAGSHGVWGLDDHFHLIYILGASQMVDFKKLESEKKSSEALNYRMGLTPTSLLNPSALKRNRTRNLYYNAIAFIKRVKFGPFNEHSPLLYEICTSKTWEKIAKGMVRMYYGEVLSKFPVVQHFYFGHVLLPWLDKDTLAPLPESSPEDEEPTGEKPDIDDETTFRSGAEIAMDSLYSKREHQLAKLQNEKNRLSSTGNRGGAELPTSNSRWPTNTPKTKGK